MLEIGGVHGFAYLEEMDGTTGLLCYMPVDISTKYDHYFERKRSTRRLLYST